MFAKIRVITVVALMMMCLVAIPVFSQDANDAFVNQVEQQLFSTQYKTDNVSDRLSRLEETIFGAPSPNDPVNIRVERLKALLAPATELPQQPEVTNQDIPSQNPIPSNQLSNQDRSIQDYSNYTQEQLNAPVDPEDQEVEDYPVLSYLENQVFNESYKGEDITQRLSRLEQNVFNQVKTGESLSERIDGLKLAIVGNNDIDLVPRTSVQHDYQSDTGGTYYQDPRMNSQNYFPSPKMNTFQYSDENLGPNYSQPPNYNQSQNYSQSQNYNETEYMPAEPGYDMGNISDEGLKEVTSRLEEQLLGQAFPNEPLNNRLDRLEMQVFNKTATSYAPESRIERLVAVTAADATSDPNDMKKVQRLRKVQTGLTIGGLLFSVLRGFLF